MKIGIVTPAPPGSRYGNRVTAVRWARILRKLGHRVSIDQDYDGRPLDLMIALHARRSSKAVARFRRAYPDAPIVVALTGTDLYRDLDTSRRARESLDLASRIIVLQPKALDKLRQGWRRRARVIYQSVSFNRGSKQSTRLFNVCVVGHLRPVKDPFRAALAARLLSKSSRVRVIQVGAAMTPQAARRARTEERINHRYKWLGERSRARVRMVLERSSVCVLSSLIEGGANIIGEAIIAGTPLLASRIPGTVGILGEDYPGYFEVGDTRQLAGLMVRAETQPEFLFTLEQHCERLAPLFDPAAEEASMAELIEEICEPARKLGPARHSGRGWRR